MNLKLKNFLLSLILGAFLILPYLVYAQIPQPVQILAPEGGPGGFISQTARSTAAIKGDTTAISTQTKILQTKAQEEQRARLLAKREAEIKNRWGFAFGQALMNGLNFFFSRLAYDAAADLAGYNQEGHEPRIERSRWKEYLTNISLDAAGEFLGTIQQSNWQSNVLSKKFNFDFCAPDLRIRYNILLQLFHEVEPRPKCTWNQIKAAGTAFWDRWTGPQSQQTALSLVGFQLQPGQTDLSLSLALNDKMLANSRDRQEAKKNERLEGRGFRGVLSPISKTIRTPAATIEQNIQYAINDASTKTSEISSAALLFNANVWAGLGANTLSVFANTLAQKLAQRVIAGLVPDVPVPEPVIPEPGTELGDAGVQVGAINVRVAYGDLLKPSIIQFSNYNPLTEFTTCDSFARGAKNCVIDQKFAQAINERLTVREALQKDYLHANFPLHYAGGSKNADPNCYLTGYCESNLKKLRTARIVPIGWEIAASKSSDDYPITLGEVVANFNNQQSRWYRLIDPDWLLKLPLTQCQAMVYGATRLSADSPGREQVCVDAPTCIEEDEKGNCIGGYGYCSREKNVWKLGGDICLAQYASCLTFQPRQGPAVNYLLDTVDKEVCSAENVGCKGYSLRRNNDGFWPVAPAVYLDKDAPACDSKDAGCTELISKKFGVPLNLLGNASFEKDVDSSGLPDGWIVSGAPSSEFYFDPATSNPQAASFIGERLLRLPATGLIEQYRNISLFQAQQNVKLSPSTIYTISLYAKTGSNSKIVNQIPQLGNTVLPPPRLILDVGQSLFGLATNCNLTQVGTGIVLDVPAVDNYERFSCTFTTPPASNQLSITMSISSAYSMPVDSTKPSMSGILIDAIQLEEGPAATPFLESGYGSVQKTYLKVAPDYLNCALDDSRAECQKYASVCLPEEVGCELYAPTDGDPAVPGIVGSGDRCPAECVGYTTFKQEPTNFEVASFPLYLIPKTGQSCNAKAVGCDEFTNLEAVAAGGETREYFSSVRLCQKPASDSATFYTWEGSDTVGYQLKSWNLKKSNQNDGPCTKLSSTNPGQCADDSVTGVCAPEEVTTNPDCREFYDQVGNIYRRLYSKTIVSSADCKPHRKTDSNQINCQGTGGAWNVATGICVYNIYRPESGQCSAAEAGCRAYTGNAGKNIFTVFNDTFSDKTAGAWTGGVPSSEAIKVGDSSLTSKTNLLVRDLSKTPAQVGKTYLLEFWAKGISKSGGLQIKLGGTNLSEAYFAGVVGKAKVDLGVEWQEYRLGPLEASQASMIDDQRLAISNFNLIFIDNIVLREVSDNIYLIKNSWDTPASCDQTQNGTLLPQAMLGCEEYKDRAGTPNYLKSFDRLCREKAVGCEAFINTYNSAEIEEKPFDMGGTSVTVPRDKNVYLVNDKKFACTGEVAGCSALGEHKINQVCTLELACNNQFGCPCPATGTESCTVLRGERSCSFKRPPGSLETKYILNQPDKYNETLCKVNAEGCEAYTYAPTGQIYYFKTPESQLCEFREISNTSGGLISRGWFKKGTTDPCGYTGTPAQSYRTPYLINGTEYGIWKNGDNMFESYVGECTNQYSSCTKFEDSFDKSTLYPQGKPYYYLKNDKISAGDCGNAINPKDGCILLRDNSIPDLTYNTELTYSQAETVRGRVPPVNCDLSSVNCGVKKNDANAIIKVKQDRACTDWLTCKTSTLVFDPTTNQPRELCLGYERCIEYSVSTSGAVCTKFAPLTSEITLAEATYTARDVSYRGEEYSGFSATGLQHVATMNVTSEGKLDVGTNLVVPLECRGYPEADSPFPSYLAEFDPNNRKIITYKQGWSGANICNSDNPSECQCDYYKADYQSGATNYYDLNKELTHPGLCSGGTRDGLPCIPDVGSRSSYFKENWSCGAGGTCEPLERLDSFLGLKGFCLEKDKSLNINGQKDQFNCLLWYPGNIGFGGRDIYNYFEKAGFSPLYSATGGRFYCAKADNKNEICTQLVDVGKPQERVYAHTSLLSDSAASEINRKFADRFPPFGSAQPRLFTPAQTPDVPWVTFSSPGIEQSCVLTKNENLEQAKCLNEDGCKCHQALTPSCTINFGEDSCVIPLKTQTNSNGYSWWDKTFCYPGRCPYLNAPPILSWVCSFQAACNNPAGCECRPNKYCEVSGGSNSCNVQDINKSGDQDIPCGPQYEESAFKDEEFGCVNGGCLCETKFGSCKVEKDQTSCQISRSLIYGGTSISKQPLDAYGDTLEKLFGYIPKFFQYATSTKSYSTQSCKDSDLVAPYPCIDAVNIAGQELTGSSLTSSNLLPQPPIVKYVNQTGFLTAPLNSKSDLGLTVNNLFSSDSVIFKTGGVLSSEIKFAYFTKDHGPIIGLKIDWEGDGVFDFKTSDSKYKNKAPPIVDANGEIIAPGCSIGDFAGSDKACDSQAVSFRHTYLYDAGDTVNCNFIDAHFDLGIAQGKKHCHFKPRVQAMDNWGYCNGSCPGGVDGNNTGQNFDTRCFDADKKIFSNNAAQECSAPDSNDNPWTEFKGLVVVAP